MICTEFLDRFSALWAQHFRRWLHCCDIYRGFAGSRRATVAGPAALRPHHSQCVKQLFAADFSSYFPVFQVWKNQSTYAYIVAQREAEEAARSAPPAPKQPRSCCSGNVCIPIHCHSNREQHQHLAINNSVIIIFT